MPHVLHKAAEECAMENRTTLATRAGHATNVRQHFHQGSENQQVANTMIRYVWHIFNQKVIHRTFSIQ